MHEDAGGAKRTERVISEAQKSAEPYADAAKKRKQDVQDGDEEEGTNWIMVPKTRTEKQRARAPEQLDKRRPATRPPSPPYHVLENDVPAPHSAALPTRADYATDDPSANTYGAPLDSASQVFDGDATPAPSPIQTDGTPRARASELDSLTRNDPGVMEDGAPGMTAAQTEDQPLELGQTGGPDEPVISAPFTTVRRNPKRGKNANARGAHPNQSDEEMAERPNPQEEGALTPASIGDTSAAVGMGDASLVEAIRAVRDPKKQTTARRSSSKKKGKKALRSLPPQPTQSYADPADISGVLEATTSDEDDTPGARATRAASSRTLANHVLTSTPLRHSTSRPHLPRSAPANPERTSSRGNRTRPILDPKDLVRERRDAEIALRGLPSADELLGRSPRLDDDTDMDFDDDPEVQRMIEEEYAKLLTPRSRRLSPLPAFRAPLPPASPAPVARRGEHHRETSRGRRHDDRDAQKERLADHRPRHRSREQYDAHFSGDDYDNGNYSETRGLDHRLGRRMQDGRYSYATASGSGGGPNPGAYTPAGQDVRAPTAHAPPPARDTRMERTWAAASPPPPPPRTRPPPRPELATPPRPRRAEHPANADDDPMNGGAPRPAPMNDGQRSAFGNPPRESAPRDEQLSDAARKLGRLATLLESSHANQGRGARNTGRTLQLALPPNGGYPYISDASPLAWMRGMRLAQASTWHEWGAMDDCALVESFNVAMQLDETRRSVRPAIMETIAQLTGGGDFELHAPQQDPNCPGIVPTWHLVRFPGQPARLRELLANFNNDVLGSARIAIRTRPAGIVNPYFLFTLSGFDTAHSDDPAATADDERKAQEVVMRHFRSRASYAEISRIMTAAHGVEGHAARFEGWLRTITATRVPFRDRGGALAPYFIIRCSPPTPDAEDWAAFRRHASSLSYQSNTFGTGTVDPFRDCTYCHSVDHSRGLCPFTRMANWLGPAPDPLLRYLNHNPVAHPEFGPPPPGYRGNGVGGPQNPNDRPNGGPPGRPGGGGGANGGNNRNDGRRGGGGWM